MTGSQTGWERTRIKFVADVNRRTLSDATDVDFTFDYVDIGRVAKGKIEPSPLEVTFGEAPSRARRLAEPGDTIVSTVRTYLRAVATVGHNKTPQVFSTGFAVLHPRRLVAHPGFLSYYLQSDSFVDRVVANSVGVSYPAINASEIGSLELWIPSITDQGAIADFLDRETAEIDAIIEAQRDLVHSMEERRAAVLLNSAIGAFTHLPPVRLSRVLARLNRPSPAELGVVTAYRDGEVTLRANRRDDGYTFSETEGGYQGVRSGDVVFHALDGFAGAVGVSDSDGKCTPVYHVCLPRRGVDARFVALVLRALGLSGFLTAFAWSVRQRSVDFRNWSLFGAIPVRIPTLDEQRDAVAEINESFAQIDRVAVAAADAIALLEERRSALISAAIAGEVDPCAGRRPCPDNVGVSA